jgi:hypothetical protein
MIAVLAEDNSDAETLVVIVRRLLNNERAPVLKKGFNGCGELCRKATAHINMFRNRGAKRFVICHDSDRTPPEEVHRKIHDTIVRPTGIAANSLVVIPVEEIEAWIIADEAAVRSVIPSFELTPVAHPETKSSPKEWLEDQSRVRTARPLYSHATHNPRVAEHLNFERVAQKCPSFRPLVAFIQTPA